jgi:hypothetical protein
MIDILRSWQFKQLPHDLNGHTVPSAEVTDQAILDSACAAPLDLGCPRPPLLPSVTADDQMQCPRAEDRDGGECDGISRRSFGKMLAGETDQNAERVLPDQHQHGGTEWHCLSPWWWTRDYDYAAQSEQSVSSPETPDL